MTDAITVGLIAVGGVAGGIGKDIWVRLRTERAERLARAERAEAEKQIEAEKIQAAKAADQEAVLVTATGWEAFAREQLLAKQHEYEAKQRECEECQRNCDALRLALDQVVSALVDDNRRLHRMIREGRESREGSRHRG